VVAWLLERDPAARVVGIDLAPPVRPHPRLEHHARDVRDRGLAALFAERGVEAVLHFAFVLDPLYDEAEMTDIDVGGTENVLAACHAARVPYVLATSSTTAYGALADNPVPLVESHPLRAARAFNYAHDKRLMDEALARFAARNPEIATCVLRPGIVLGPNVANYIATMLVRPPVV
jgi:UDP-glucose 4-epimerase